MPAAPASRAAGREVTPVELFRLLPAHFAAVLVCALLGGILAFAAARLAPRSYQAEAQLYVAAAQEGLTSGYAELQLTADYQELLTSRTMLESVISTLGLSTDTAHLKDQITILHPADTHILRIVAADFSPQRAADIANALAALALDDLSARMGTTPPRLVEQAAPPQCLSGPGAVFHAALGVGIGFLLCFAGTWLLSAKAGELKTPFLEGFSPGPCLMAAGLFSLCTQPQRLHRPAERLSRASFCIYLVHIAVLRLLGALGLHANRFAMLSIPAVAVLCGAISYFIYLPLSKLPWIKRWLI